MTGKWNRWEDFPKNAGKSNPPSRPAPDPVPKEPKGDNKGGKK